MKPLGIHLVFRTHIVILASAVLMDTCPGDLYIILRWINLIDFGIAFGVSILVCIDNATFI